MSEKKTPAKTPAKKKPAPKPTPKPEPEVLPEITFQGRARIELAELNIRRDGLTSFMSFSVFPTLPKRDQELLVAQAASMKRYSQILQERVDRFGVKGV